MSRFSVKVSTFEQSSLSDVQIKDLFLRLEHKLPLLEGIANRTIIYMKKKHIPYRLITVGTDYVITIRNNDNAENRMCIGYPFPVVSELYNANIHDGFQVSYYIRGKSLRNAQRACLIQKLQTKTKFSQVLFNTCYGLRHELAKHIKAINPDTLYYCNLYRFIGDSFLSTYMLDAFAKEFGINKVVLLSQKPDKLSGFYNAVDLNDWANVKSGGIYVFSDLLDIDDALVQDFAVTKAKDGIYILNSRNAFFIRHGNNVQFFAVKNKPDVLLTYGNIFPYMQRCIEPFVKTKLQIYQDKITLKKLKSVYINPFSSSLEKGLSMQKIKNLVQELRTAFKGIKIFVPFGCGADEKKFSAKISKLLNLERLKDDGFYDLINKMHHVDLIITVDTALTHIATKYNIKNIVIFKTGFWDSWSLQSLAAESPLSFCSMNPCQLSVVLPEGENVDFSPVLQVIYTMLDPKNKTINIKYNFCSRHFSLIKNIGLKLLNKRLSLKHKLKYYTKG